MNHDAQQNAPPTVPTTNEIIPPSEARQRLSEAIIARLGPQWEDDWEVVSDTDYHARLTRGGTNLDFYVDLLGAVTVEEKALNAGQDMGNLIWLMLLTLAALTALLVARLSGYI
jgi:hypothetical protein